jgi:hypothetical protein
MKHTEQDLLPFTSRMETAELIEAKWRQRTAAMLDPIADSKRKCQACEETIWFIARRGGKTQVWDASARSHFATCPHADKWRTKK